MLFAKLELNYTRNYNRSFFSGEYCLLFIIAFLKKKKNLPSFYEFIPNSPSNCGHTGTWGNVSLQLLEDTSPKASWQGQPAGGSGQVGLTLPPHPGNWLGRTLLDVKHFLLVPPSLGRANPPVSSAEWVPGRLFLRTCTSEDIFILPLMVWAYGFMGKSTFSRKNIDGIIFQLSVTGEKSDVILLLHLVYETGSSPLEASRIFSLMLWNFMKMNLGVV